MPTDPLAFLFSLERLGMKFGLENMTVLCAALGHPERAFASVHVAGTNGKGSVTAMCETALRAAGHRTARYTSPHLTRLEERFVIDGAEVAPETLRRAAGRVQSVALDLVSDGGLPGLPTFFECTTAIAFELFRDARVNIAVVEVGLGGRLDATNVLSPVVTAITSIDFDHQAQLGTTIESIAREKAGIIKPGVPAVCGPIPPEAEAAIIDACEAHGAPLVRAGGLVTVRDAGTGSPLLDVRTTRRAIEGITPGLAGRYQVANAAVAVGILEELESRGWQITDDAIVAGLSRVSWPGRLELFRSGGAEVLVDAAHNPAGARALADHLGSIGWDKVTLVFGAMQDKDVEGMLSAIVPRCATIICTTPDTARAMPAAELAQLAEALTRGAAIVRAIDEPVAALAHATASRGRVVVAGSIFLIGPLRDILR